MKNECNVVRDLMPLVIDNVASEESRELVTEHVWKCESCAAAYKGLQSQIANGSDAAEAAAFARAADELKRLKTKRRAIIIAVTTLVTALVLLVGSGVWNFLHTHGFPVRADSYSIHLLQIKGTNIVMEWYEDTEHVIGYSSYTEITHDGQKRVNITAEAPLLSTETHDWNYVTIHDNYMLIDGKLYHRSFEWKATEAIDEIVQVGRDDTEKVVYKQGDSIPVSSDELAAYYQARIAYHDWRNSTEARYTDIEEVQRRSEELQALRDLVPEFK